MARLKKIRWIRVQGMRMSTGGPAKPKLWSLPKGKKRRKAKPVSIMKAAEDVGKTAKRYRLKYFQRKKKTIYG